MKDATSRIEPLFVKIGGRTPAGHLLSGAAVAAATLLAHELARALERAREWIVDSSDALPFVAYVSIPVVSGLGSELLERALEATVAR